MYVRAPWSSAVRGRTYSSSSRGVCIDDRTALLGRHPVAPCCAISRGSSSSSNLRGASGHPIAAPTSSSSCPQRHLVSPLVSPLGHLVTPHACCSGGHPQPHHLGAISSSTHSSSSSSSGSGCCTPAARCVAAGAGKGAAAAVTTASSSSSGSSKRGGKKSGKGAAKASKGASAKAAASNNILPAEGLSSTTAAPSEVDLELLQLLAEEVEEEEAEAFAAAAAAAAAGAAGVGGALMGAGGEFNRRRWHSQRALVLDLSHRPINIINWFKAVVMDMAGKVDVLDYYPDAYAYSARAAHPLPAVLRARTYVNPADLGGVALSRKNIMLRDRHTCQYCGSRADLTIDHVVPVSSGGGNTWDNLVTACMACNQRKGSKSLKSLGWRLRNVPKEPSAWELGTVGLAVGHADVLNPPEQWAPYLQPYQERLHKRRRGSISSNSSSSTSGAVPAASPASG